MLNRTVKFKAATFPIGDVAASFSLLSNHGKLETAKGFWFAAAALTCVACNLSDGKRNGRTLFGDSVPRPSAGQRLQRKSEPLLSQRPRLCNHVRSEGPCLRPPLAFTGLREEGKLPGLRRATALQRRVPELARRLIRNQLLSNELRVRVPCPPPFHYGVCEISQALFSCAISRPRKRDWRPPFSAPPRFVSHCVTHAARHSKPVSKHKPT